MAPSRLARVLALLSAIGLSSCDAPATSSSVGRLASAPSATIELTGTWTGSAIDSAGRVEMIWQLTRTGTQVTGNVTATTNVGAPVYTGSLSGTLSADTLRFTIVVPAGRITDMPDCRIDLSGSATDILPDSMAGTYTGTHSCIGEIEAGRLLMIR